jgi:hypothetical protein
MEKNITNGQKCTKSTLKMQNCPKIQIGYKIFQFLPLQGPPKNNPNWDFLFENVPPGNPGWDLAFLEEKQQPC